MGKFQEFLSKKLGEQPNENNQSDDVIETLTNNIETLSNIMSDIDHDDISRIKDLSNQLDKIVKQYQ